MSGAGKDASQPGADSSSQPSQPIDLGNIFAGITNGITVDQAVVLIGVLVLLIFIVVTSIGIKVFCCHDKRKFRSSKDVKCVRHQESMTSPLDSPLRSVISIATNGQQMTIESEQDNLIRNKESGHQNAIEMQPNYATLPTPSARSKKLDRPKQGSIPNILGHENENGRILSRSSESPSVYKTSSVNNVNSPTKPVRSRKRSESSISSGRQIKAQIHDEEKAPKGSISEVNIQPPITVQLNEEMKSKLSAIKDPSRPQSTNQRPLGPLTNDEPRPQKSYSTSTTSNALTSSESEQYNSYQNQRRQQADPALPRMWFVSLDNITPEPVYRGNLNRV